MYQEERKNINVYLTALFFLFLPYFFQETICFPYSGILSIILILHCVITEGGKYNRSTFNQFRKSHCHKPRISLEKITLGFYSTVKKTQMTTGSFTLLGLPGELCELMDQSDLSVFSRTL